MVPVGVIGLGPAWDSRYLPALRQLRTRIGVRALYDAVPSRAITAAAEFDARTSTGLLAIARRPDIRALLVFETGWGGAAALRVLCGGGRPLFVGGAMTSDDAAFERLRAAATGVTVMPELGHRYTPASNRLRELIATRLGRPERIEIEAAAPKVPTGGQPLGRRPWDEFVGRLVDWGCYVVPTRPIEVAARSESPHGADLIRLTFDRPRSGRDAPTLDIRLSRPDASPASPGRESAEPVYRVRCERGEAELKSADRIVWRAGTESADECLTSERSDVQVMLDHFCRRVVGGLIPVADLGDVHRSRVVVRAAEEGFRSGEAVGLEGRF